MESRCLEQFEKDMEQIRRCLDRIAATAKQLGVDDVLTFAEAASKGISDRLAELVVDGIPNEYGCPLEQLEDEAGMFRSIYSSAREMLRPALVEAGLAGSLDADGMQCLLEDVMWISGEVDEAVKMLAPAAALGGQARGAAYCSMLAGRYDAILSDVRRAGVLLRADPGAAVPIVAKFAGMLDLYGTLWRTLAGLMPVI